MIHRASSPIILPPSLVRNRSGKPVASHGNYDVELHNYMPAISGELYVQIKLDF